MHGTALSDYVSVRAVLHEPKNMFKKPEVLEIWKVRVHAESYQLQV
jgi:hypothetical protein